MPLTDERVMEFDANSFDLRYVQKSRPPTFDVLVEFIRERFGQHMDVEVLDWSYTPRPKPGRSGTQPDLTRRGKLLRVTASGPDTISDPSTDLEHRTCDPYSTNWDIVSWIAKRLRESHVVGTGT